MEKVIEYINANNKANMKPLMSTPQRYVDAVKKVNPALKVFYNDMFPYSDEKNDFWSGYYSSRPGSKVEAKHASSFYHASNLLFA